MKHLVLLGGGHAHVHCMASFATTPLNDVQITLVSPFARQVYSGMLPGWVAGHYAIDECVIPLAPLAQRMRATFLQTAAIGFDPTAREVHCEDGTTLPYDIVSIDTGPVADLTHLPGAQAHALVIRPIERFIEDWQRARQHLVARLRAGARARVAMVGAGAGGIELAFAIHYAMERAGVPLEIKLISAQNSLPGTVGTRIKQALDARGINVIGNTAASAIDAGRVVLPDGRGIEADLIVVATGTAAATWPGAAGLKTDERGFILTNDYLQSVSHPNVFARAWRPHISKKNNLISLK